MFIKSVLKLYKTNENPTKCLFKDNFCGFCMFTYENVKYLINEVFKNVYVDIFK